MDFIMVPLEILIIISDISFIVTYPSEKVEKGHYGGSYSYDNSAPTKAENSCPLIGGKACIVDEWQPICLLKECIIDSREGK